MTTLNDSPTDRNQPGEARHITIRRAHPTERAAALPLAEAFSDDPVMATFVPAGPDRRRRLENLFWAMLRSGPLQSGSTDVAVDERGTVVGTAAWEAPHTGREPILPTVEQIPNYVRALGLRGSIAALRHRAVLQRPRPRLPHWYLAEIGVSSAARGFGVGTLLLEHRLELIDHTRDAAYLESSTERNRALYRRHGFVELGIIEGLPSGAPMAMWRPRR